ncbi:MAG: ASCH domain-containing protein [Patescibacteria group bacterium]|nr:ASCH domain-containing protein [Patescibacteria group bacterium]
MDHVAFMKKSWGLLPKILSGEKKIESRWYLNRSAPWGKIHEGDTVYFKNSGEPITVRCEVGKVTSFERLTPNKVRQILNEYGRDDGIKAGEIESYYNLFKNKNYCLLIFLKNPQKVIPFNINKKGFGSMAAWVTADDIRDIKV